MIIGRKITKKEPETAKRNVKVRLLNVIILDLKPHM